MNFAVARYDGSGSYLPYENSFVVLGARAGLTRTGVNNIVYYDEETNRFDDLDLLPEKSSGHAAALVSKESFSSC